MAKTTVTNLNDSGPGSLPNAIADSAPCLTCGVMPIRMI